MVFIYLGSFYPTKYQSICNEDGMPSPAFRFNKSLAEGFATVDKVKVKAITSLSNLKQIKTSSSLLNEEENNVEYIYNLSDDSYVHYCISAIKLIRKEAKSNSVVIMSDAISLCASLVCLLSKRYRSITTVAIVTDIPYFIGRTVGTLKSKLWGSITAQLMKTFDSYVLLTPAMHSVVNKKNRKECVMEGLATEAYVLNSSNKTSDKRIVLYAGALCEEYGIKTLVEAFKEMEMRDCELHLYGDGEYRGQIEETCKTCESIKYFGAWATEYIFEREQEATLLVNPRPVNLDYAIFSFPSKTIEYMASGTPVIMTRLPGVPEEYFNYVYLFENDSKEALFEGLNRALNLDLMELEKFGLKAKEFVLTNKNATKQAQRIIEELELL